MQSANMSSGTQTNIIQIEITQTRRPRSRAQSGSRIYQFGDLGRGGGGLWNSDAEFKFAKIQNSHVEGGGGGPHGILMLSSNLLKSKIPMSGGGGGGGWWNQFSTFDAESKLSGSPIRSIGEPHKCVNTNCDAQLQLQIFSVVSVVHVLKGQETIS